MGVTGKDIPSVFQQFACKGTFNEHHRYGSGHIHQTWLVETVESDAPDYILQKISSDVFRNIPALMENIRLVTTHLAEKGSPSLQLVTTSGHQPYYVDDQGDSWRLFVYIPDSLTLDHTDDPGRASEAGKAIGNFQYLLSDLNANLHETLPGFHDVEYRMEQFRKACREDPAGRCLSVQAERDRVEEWYQALAPFRETIALQRFPLRVIHNDTKLNNILFDREGKAICMIDLDTVMPGYVHYDVGDALRILSNTAAEDERDLSHVGLDLRILEAFLKGYLGEAVKFITPEERAWLPLAPLYMTFIIGLRFLTDHIQGDRYFHIRREGHNLDRARVQFAFARKLNAFQDRIWDGFFNVNISNPII
ncbi:MAG TPA: aminoglycoside phosphotransferase family protein [Bacteroidales bacterium]|nr:aminoglycoside phosphotransferase family protein [Bacteroidales bacterium]